MTPLLRFLSLTLTLLTATARGAAPLPDPGPGTHCANLASAPDGTVHLTYYGPPPLGAAAGARTLWLTSLPAGATEWTPPRPIVTTPLLQENWADFASVVTGADGALTAQWFQRAAPDARGYDGWYSRSEDGGRSWRSPARLGHEFVALAPLAAGDTLAVWLEGAHPHHAGGTGHPAAAPKAAHGGGMRLLGRILAPDGTARRDWVLDPEVCDCCQNTAVALGDGRVFVAYRGRTRGEIRDNRYLIFDPATASWSRAATLREDGWVIPACPVNGPAADALGEVLAVAWFTAAGGQPRIHARHSADGARTLGEPQGIDVGQPMGRLDTVMLRDGSAVVTWLEAGSGGSEAGIYARRIFPGGGLSAPSLVAASSRARSSGFPRTARHGPDAVLVGWTQTGEAPQVRLTSVPLTKLGRVASAR
ncbi:MAG: hypothetical protein ACKOUK_02540 [Verrucomicrobiota bacterium]